MSLTHRDKKYLDKKRYQREGSDELIFELIKLFNQSVQNKEKPSQQVSFVENLCFKISSEKDLKQDEQKFLADTIYKYALGNGFLRVEKGRVTLTQKSKKHLGIK